MLQLLVDWDRLAEDLLGLDNQCPVLLPWYGGDESLLNTTIKRGRLVGARRMESLFNTHFPNFVPEMEERQRQQQAAEQQQQQVGGGQSQQKGSAGEGTTGAGDGESVHIV